VCVCGLDCTGSVWGLEVGCYEHVHEQSGSVKSDEFIDQLCNYQILRKDPPLCSFFPFVL